jgi:hypothetical protein
MSARRSPDCGINAGTEAASNRFAGMASPRQSKPSSTKFRFWRVSIPGGKRSEYVGIVEAPDQQSAEADAAVKEFKLSDEDRKRLVVRTRD